MNILKSCIVWKTQYDVNHRNAISVKDESIKDKGHMRWFAQWRNPSNKKSHVWNKFYKTSGQKWEYCLILTCDCHAFVFATRWLWEHWQAKHGIRAINKVKCTNESIIAEHSFSRHVHDVVWGNPLPSINIRFSTLMRVHYGSLRSTQNSRRSWKVYGFR